MSTICQICGDDVGLTVDGEQFIACVQCSYPVCRPCYEYERKEGGKACPNCKTIYPRHKGSPWIDTDARHDDDDDDDLHHHAAGEAWRSTSTASSFYTSVHHHPSVPSVHSVGGMSNIPASPLHTGGSTYYHRTESTYHQDHDALSDYDNLTSVSQQQHSHVPHTNSIPAGQLHMGTAMHASSSMGGGNITIATPSTAIPSSSNALVPAGAFLPGVVGQATVGAKAGPEVPEVRALDPNKNLHDYGFGSVVWNGKSVESLAKSEEEAAKNQMSGLYGMADPLEGMGDEEKTDLPRMDESRQPLSRKVPIPSQLISPYRLVIVTRFVITCFFMQWRIRNPVPDAPGLWMSSIICELWFFMSWILDQFPKWKPLKRETYLDRLSMRYEKSKTDSQLSGVDLFITTVDPRKEPPLTTANTILSILAIDYPADKVAVYLSDDGGSMLTFDVIGETAQFARVWAPFCRKYSVEPRAPEVYFLQKVDFLKDKTDATFVNERRQVKREYEEFKVRINALVARANNPPDDGWTMQDGTPWPGNKTRDHPGMIQVFLGPNGGPASDGSILPRLVYVSREKRPGYNHHKKAGAMNALVRVSAVLTNAPFILNLDCDHYVNNSRSLREGMCFLMDPTSGPRCCFVQFPQRFDGIDPSDRYANHNTVFFDINMPGLDGIQGPVYVGTGCCFRRQALYGFDPKRDTSKKTYCNVCSLLCSCCSCCPGPRDGAAGSWTDVSSAAAATRGGRRRKGRKGSLAAQDGMAPTNAAQAAAIEEDEAGSLMALKKFERRFGQSPVFVLSTFQEEGGGSAVTGPGSTMKEAIHVISCGYEDGTDWGKEIGWIYGSITEDILTGFKMHCRGWRSTYCTPKRVAFKGSAPINLSDRLQQVLRWALGSIEIFLSRHCPIWYGYRINKLKTLQRLAYINTVVYPFTSFPLVTYCMLPAICLLTGKFIIPTLDETVTLYFIGLFLSIIASYSLECRWSGVSLTELWRNEQFWVIGGVSAHLFAVFQGLLKVFAGIDTNFTVTSKQADDGEFAELYLVKWTSLLIPPTFLIVINVLGIIAGIADAVNTGNDQVGMLFGKLFFSFWVILHLYPFLKGLSGRNKRVPTLVIVWASLLAFVFSALWTKINPYNGLSGPTAEECGVRC